MVMPSHTDMNVDTLSPEILWLESEQFVQAKAICQGLHHPFDHDSSPALPREPDIQQEVPLEAQVEQRRWQTYLNALALLALQEGLQEWLPHGAIEAIEHQSSEVSYLEVERFKLCLIAREHVLDDGLEIARHVVDHAEWAAHFYLLLEVLEDQEQVILRGFWRHDELRQQIDQVVQEESGDSSMGCYRVPLFSLDPEFNHLLTYVQYVDPSTIPLPSAVPQTVELAQQQPLSRIRLGDWLQGVLDEGWQALDTLINPEANLAWATRNEALGAKGGKLINLGMDLGAQSVILLITVTPGEDGKVGIHAQVLPTGGTQVLPAQLKLTLFSSVDKILQAVQARDHDNAIQLKPFRGKPGTRFSIEVALRDITVREMFEL